MSKTNILTIFVTVFLKKSFLHVSHQNIVFKKIEKNVIENFSETISFGKIFMGLLRCYMASFMLWRFTLYLVCSCACFHDYN